MVAPQHRGQPRRSAAAESIDFDAPHVTHQTLPRLSFGLSSTIDS